MADFKRNMKRLFNPDSVAVIGASENPGKLGAHVMKSLREGGFKGNILPVNPGSSEVLGLRSYASLADIKDRVDLAVVVVPARFVPGIFRECEKADVRGIVLITAGFREIEDPSGSALQEEIAGIANRAGIPVIGPNTFGMVNLHASLNASFTPQFSLLRKGKVCLISQSGGMSHLIGFLALRMDLGFSKIVGLGNRLNVDFAEMMDYLMEDSDTEVILLYVEGMDAPGALLEKTSRDHGSKPVLAYKTGSARVGGKASRSHTGTLAGRYEIYKGAFEQAGIFWVDNTDDFLDLARAMAAPSLPLGPGVAILSAQAGPAMAASDVCEKAGLRIVQFTKETQQKINDRLPPLALRSNPVDMGPAWYDASAIKGIVQAVMEDDGVNGILLLMMYASANEKALDGLEDLLMDYRQRKPVISCILSPPGIWDSQIRRLEEKNALINFPTPERAAYALSGLWRYKSRYPLTLA